MLVRGSIPSLIGGVSQQDDAIRALNQVEAAENCWMHPALGNGKRPPAQTVATLASDIDPDAFEHVIKRDHRENYLVIIESGKVRVFDHVTGKEYTVIAHAPSLAYLSCTGKPWKSFAATTIADATFLVNREVVCRMDASKPGQGYVTASVQTFEDLPKTGGVGVYAITGDPNNGFDTYYVSRKAANTWEEVAKPGIEHWLDPETMPHVLKRVPDGTNPDGFYFSYGPWDWQARPAGDEDSNPTPSFVGQTFNDVCLYRDRLGLLSSENIILSEVGHYENFWRTTVTSLLDSDPIDVAVQMNEVSTLRHAVAYQRSLMLMSDNAIYQLTGEPALSPKTVKVDFATAYPSDPWVRPVLSGSSMYFARDNSLSTTMYEYVVDNTTLTGEAGDVTGPVPAYLPGEPRALLTLPDKDILFVAPQNGGEHQLYVYAYRWQGDRLSQAAWSRWSLKGVGRVVSMASIGSAVYIAAVAGSGLELLKIDLETDARMANVTNAFDIMLDRRVLVTPTYHAFGSYTDIALPYALESLSDVSAIKGEGWEYPGSVLDLSEASLMDGGTTIRLQGRHDGGKLAVGLKYTQWTTLSRQFVRDGQGAPTRTGRLQLRTMEVAYRNTAFFRVRVSPKARPDAAPGIVTDLLDSYEGRTLGDSAFLTGTPQLRNGSFKAMVLGRADATAVSLENDSPYPSWFQSVEWEGFYTSRTR